MKTEVYPLNQGWALGIQERYDAILASKTTNNSCAYRIIESLCRDAEAKHGGHWSRYMPEALYCEHHPREKEDDHADQQATTKV